jgi:hypothetical protein
MHVQVQIPGGRLGFDNGKVQRVIRREAKPGHAAFEPVQEVYDWEERLVQPG